LVFGGCIREREGPMPGGDEIRNVQRVTWAGLSAGWEKWDSVIMDQLGPVGTAMIGRLGIAGDQQHLDIAAGTGEPGLTVARLAPGGHVVLADLAAEMLGIAARRADALGIANLGAAVCSAGDLPSGDAVFDSISVRFGYMFFPDVAQATAEFARAQAGRASVLVGMGQARGKPVDGDRHAGDRGGGGTGAIGAGRAGYVPVRCAGVCQCPVRGRGAARRCRVGRRRRAGDAIARAVLGDDQRARLARSRGACAGQRTGASAKTVMARVSSYEENGTVRIPGLARCIIGTR
jgi:SAM-dependent methyltransferase